MKERQRIDTIIEEMINMADFYQIKKGREAEEDHLLTKGPKFRVMAKTKQNGSDLKTLYLSQCFSFSLFLISFVFSLERERERDK